MLVPNAELETRVVLEGDAAAAREFLHSLTHDVRVTWSGPQGPVWVRAVSRHGALVRLVETASAFEIRVLSDVRLADRIGQAADLWFGEAAAAA